MVLSRRSYVHYVFIWVFAFIGVFLFLGDARADVVVFDDFDDGALGAEWNIAFEHSNGWVYTEQGSNFIVTDISPTVINPGSGGTWARVILSQYFVPLTNFVLDFDFAWDSEGKLEAVQMLKFTLRSQTDKMVVRVSFHDAWIAQSGEKAVRFDQTVIQTGWNTLPLQGTASIKIVRNKGTIDVYWDGVKFATHTDAEEIVGLDLGFDYYGSVNQPIFGSESVDLVRLQGTPANQIPTMTEWGIMVFACLLGLTVIFLMRRSVFERI